MEDSDAHLRKVLDDQVAAHPQHRNRSNNADCVENLGHHAHNSAADIIRGTGTIVVRMRRALGQAKPEIIHSHQDGNDPVDEKGHEESDCDQDRDPHRHGLGVQSIHGDQHDLRGKNEVGARGRRNDAFLKILRALRGCIFG